MYQLFYDSIIIKLSTKRECDVTSLYMKVKKYISRYYHIVRLSDIPKDKLSKYNNMYLLYNNLQDYQLCLCVFSTINTIEPHSWFTVYARKDGVYVELHGFVQYTQSFTSRKLELLHLLYNEYSKIFSFSRVDIAIDIRDKFSNISIYDKNNKSLDIDNNLSSTFCYYFKESSTSRYKQSRLLKCYDKTFQKSRGFILPFYLTRVELTIKRSKLKNIKNATDMFARAKKELSYYKIYASDNEIVISNSSILTLVDDLYQVLQYGKNKLYYSNIYKNIKKLSSLAKLSYECFINRDKTSTFAKNNPISLRKLQRNISFFRRYINER